MTEQTQGVQANFDNKIDVKETLFKFRASSTKVFNDEGDPVMVPELDKEGKETGKEVQKVDVRASREIKLNIPVLSVEGVVEVFEKGGRGLEFLMEVVHDVFLDRARDILAEDENMTADNFPFDQLTWEAIANLPKEVRRGAANIAKEDWDNFATAYQNFMTSVGLKKEAVSRQASVFKQKLRPIATRKDVLPQFALLLNIFLQKCPQAGEYTEVIEYLQKANKKYMEAEAKSASDLYGLDALAKLAA